MKKNVYPIILIILTLILTSCGGTPTSKTVSLCCKYCMIKT